MTEGIDIARYQHPNNARIDWRQVYGSGRHFVFVKLSEGRSFVNSYAQSDIRDARAAGMAVGVYHFARPESNSPETEAEHFNRNVAQHSVNLPHALDLEDGEGLGWRRLAAWSVRWIELTGAGIVYVNRYYLKNVRPGWDSLDALLWLAAPTKQPPGLGEDIWQYGQGRIPGIAGEVDLNRWGGFINPVQRGRVTVNVSLPELRQGDGSKANPDKHVMTLQNLLNVKAEQGLAEDGIFGKRTAKAVWNAQTFFGMQATETATAGVWGILLFIPQG